MEIAQLPGPSSPTKDCIAYYKIEIIVSDAQKRYEN